jgi:TonB family protein
MSPNKIFPLSLTISFLAHSLVFFQYSGLLHKPEKKKRQELHISYVKRLPAQEIPVKNISLKNQPLAALPPKVTADETITASANTKNNVQNIFSKNIDNMRRPSPFIKPALIKPDTIPIKKKISLPPVEPDKIKNPSYMGYYQFVREKIRRAAYYNYVRTVTGEVYLSFVIANDGKLLDLKFLEDKSSGNGYLKQTAIKSIKDSSPFPAFPKELDYPQLSFTVIISFEVE